MARPLHIFTHLPGSSTEEVSGQPEPAGESKTWVSTESQSLWRGRRKRHEGEREVSLCVLFCPAPLNHAALLGPGLTCDTSVSAKKEFRHCTHATTEVLKFGHLEHYLTSSLQTGNWTGYTQALYCINMTKEPVNRAIQCPTNKIN